MAIANLFILAALFAIVSAESIQIPKSVRAPVASKIYFAADDVATLFVNGEQVGKTSSATTLGEVDIDLEMGDVVAVLAKDRGGAGYGVMCTIVMGTGSSQVVYRTVRDRFRARKWFRLTPEQFAWTTQDYDACEWPRVPRSGAEPSAIRKPDNLPSIVSGAGYAWPRDARSRATVFLRYRIGGEGCGSSQYRLIVTADDSARIWLNGRAIGSTGRPQAVSSTAVRIVEGDVIAMQARDVGGGYGVRATIVSTTGQVVTGRDFWRAIKWFKLPDPTSWRKSDYDVCSWQKALPPTGGGSIAQPRTIPRALEAAEYVWAPDTRGNTSIFLRYRMGGEECRGIYYTVTFSADDSARMFVNGRFMTETFTGRQVGRSIVQLRRGDVISFLARDTGDGYGIIANVKGFKLRASTGSADFRAVQQYRPEGGFRSWMMPAFDGACDWPVAVNTTGMEMLAVPPVMPPTLSDAKYVWASGVGSRKNIFMRYRIGGDGC